MNKIIIDNDQIIESDIDYNYKKRENLFDISSLVLNINNDQDLIVNIDIKDDIKLVVTFNILESVNLNLCIVTRGNNSKIQYKYNLENNSCCNVEKLNLVSSIREMVIANLDEGSSFNYLFKGIVIGNENYDFMIYHNGINSNSDIKNNLVNELGSVYLQISSFIPKNITGCFCNQYNRIINNMDNKCLIKPNLYIDCDDVVANHSALIDNFSYDDLFYLYLKGINYDDALKLLTKGFLLSNIKSDQIIDLINKRYGGE